MWNLNAWTMRRACRERRQPHNGPSSYSRPKPAGTHFEAARPGGNRPAQGDTRITHPGQPACGELKRDFEIIQPCKTCTYDACKPLTRRCTGPFACAACVNTRTPSPPATKKKTCARWPTPSGGWPHPRGRCFLWQAAPVYSSATRRMSAHRRPCRSPFFLS